MTKRSNEENYIDSLIQDLIKPVPAQVKETLRQMFERRLVELDMTTTSVAELYDIQSRTLNGILDGTLQRVEISNFTKLADFIQISSTELFSLFSEELEKNFPTTHTVSSKSIEFIKENFDLAALKKQGVIDSIKDYEHIQQQLLTILGLSSIFDYKRPPMDVAFSTGVLVPKNDFTKEFWINVGTHVAQSLNNPYPYSREALIKYFPEIRWHSTNVEIGLLNVIQSLYRMGITVIYIPRMKTGFNIRGATFSFNNKPCILLTDYRGFYPTLWFALIHELFHVLFDWDEISKSTYHTSGDSDQLSVIEKENDANNFAREYLFSKEKINSLDAYISDHKYVERFANTNDVHPSFVYVFMASDINTTYGWTIANRYNPKNQFEKLLKQLGDPLSQNFSINRKIYN